MKMFPVVADVEAGGKCAAVVGGGAGAGELGMLGHKHNLLFAY